MHRTEQLVHDKGQGAEEPIQNVNCFRLHSSQGVEKCNAAWIGIILEIQRMDNYSTSSPFKKSTKLVLMVELRPVWQEKALANAVYVIKFTRRLKYNKGTWAKPCFIVTFDLRAQASLINANSVPLIALWFPVFLLIGYLLGILHVSDTEIIAG